MCWRRKSRERLQQKKLATPPNSRGSKPNRREIQTRQRAVLAVPRMGPCRKGMESSFLPASTGCDRPPGNVLYRQNPETKESNGKTRTPTALLQLRGAFINHPSRLSARKNEPLVTMHSPNGGISRRQCQVRRRVSIDRLAWENWIFAQ
jgi:hypothetical protein